MSAPGTMHSHPHAHSHSHSHAHAHAHAHAHVAPAPPSGLQPAAVNGLTHQHSHSDSHLNGHSHSGSCGHDHGHTHSHSHSHDHAHGHDHRHDHGHTHRAGDSCSHGHSHSHDGHDHHHHHDHGPPPNYAFSVPYVKLFTDSAAQLPAKALWLCLGSAVTLGIFLAARSSSSMSLQSYSLLFLFDLVAIVNEFVSHALSRGLIAPRDPSQYSFGLQRLEVVFAFANALSLFFSGMYALKEALEVMLEEEDHKHDPTGSYNALIPIAAAVIGSLAIIRLAIHKPYYKFLSRSRFSEWTTNPFIQSHGLVATILLLVHWTQSIYAASPARTQTHVAPAADALGACAIGLVLMWLATPLAIAMGQILLQVTPAPLVSALQRACGEIASMEGVMQVAKAQYWSNALNEQVGVIHVQHRSGADPSVVREHVRERLMARVPGDWWIQVEVGQSRII